MPPVPPMRVESKQQSLPTSVSCDIVDPASSPTSTTQPLSHSMDNIQKINAWVSCKINNNWFCKLILRVWEFFYHPYFAQVPSGPMHSRQRSSPDDIMHIKENIRHNHSPDLSRSHSDVVNSSRKMRSNDSSSDLETKQRKAAESSTSRASSFGAYDSTSTDSPRVTPPGTPPPPYSSFEQAENIESIEGDTTASDEVSFFRQPIYTSCHVGMRMKSYPLCAKSQKSNVWEGLAVHV